MSGARLLEYSARTGDALVVPHDLDIERSILGAVLVNNAVWATASSVIRAEYFFRDGHAIVWRAMLRLAGRGMAIDLVTVKDELGEHGLEEAGGMAYVSRLTDVVPQSSNIEYYARSLIAKYRCREIISAAYREDLERVGAIAADNPINSTISTLHFDTAAEILSEPPMQAVITGMIPENRLTVLFGRRGVGKSQFVALMGVAVASAHTIAGLEPQSAGTVVWDDREGTSGAWFRSVVAHYNISDPGRLPIVRPRGDLMDLASIGSVRRFVTRVKDAGIRPVMTLIDTLPRAADYDENKDGSLVVRSCDYYREHLGGAIVLLTHPSEGNPDRPRGGNQIEGAADMVLKLASNDAGIVTLTSTKNRYGPPDEEFGRYRRVAVPGVRQGCVLRPANEVVDEQPASINARDVAACTALRGIGKAKHGEWKTAAKDLGLSAGQFGASLRRLSELGMVRQSNDGKYELV